MPEQWETFLPVFARGPDKRAGRKRKARHMDSDDSDEEEEHQEASPGRASGSFRPPITSPDRALATSSGLMLANERHLAGVDFEANMPPRTK